MESNYREIVQGWFSLQTSMVAGVARAVVFLGESEIDPAHPAAIWTEQATVTCSKLTASSRNRHCGIRSMA